MSNLFLSALSKTNRLRPPVWFMRQAGRYHSHYQALRRQYSFMEVCKRPEIACEATMGPIRDFDFDAAILFSDLLFPLEAMGMGLSYVPGPKLEWHLREVEDLKKLKGGGHLAQELQFQAQAMRLVRKELPTEKGLLGFVGGPLTLFCYAVEGSHQGGLESAKLGLEDGRFDGFFEKLLDLLVENMVLQSEAGADVIAVLDTCAGEFSSSVYQRRIVPTLKILFDKFKQRLPNAKLIYYSKGTGADHWSGLTGLPISGLGIDWKHSLSEVLTDWSQDWAIQGNIDPHWLLLEPKVLEVKLREVFERVKQLPKERLQGWICGLGHGVLQTTPEQNVRLFLRLQKEIWGE